MYQHLVDKIYMQPFSLILQKNLSFQFLTIIFYHIAYFKHSNIYSHQIKVILDNFVIKNVILDSVM